MPQVPTDKSASIPAPADGSATRRKQEKSGQPGAPSGSRYEIPGTIESRLAKLETTVADLKSDKGWLKTAALLFGVLGGLVSIPKAMIDFAGAVHRQPETTVIAESPLSVSYEAREGALHFESLVILKNDGNDADVIKRASASIQDKEKNTGDLVNSDDIQFSQGPSVLAAPGVLPGSPLPVTILMSINSPPQDAVQLLSGSHQLDVTLASLGKPKKISFCFNFDSKQASDIVHVKPRRLITPSCEPL